MKKFKVVTLGCRTNQYESAAYTEQLKKMGYTSVGEGEVADVCIVNTCTVTQGADRSSRHEIRSLLRKNPGAKVAVTGCMAESDPEGILAIDPGILLVGNPKKEKVIEALFPAEESYPEFTIEAFPEHTRAFVKVQDGCNSFCTYCIIPYVRGRSRSRSIEEVVKEVHQLVRGGHKEVVITGINVGDFDGGGNLADLVREVDRVEGLKRTRISSIDPDEVTDDLLGAVLEGKTTCPSLHIVLQSGSNVILKKMNRKYTKQMFLETIQKLRGASSDFTFTTDVIVGFPGETELDFQETLQMIEEIQFAKVHMFPYSPRERTRAALYPNPVSQETLHKRKTELLHRAEKSAFSLREAFVKREMTVLIENEEKEGFMAGHTPNFLKVWVPKEGGIQINEEYKVELIENREDGLLGRVL